MTETGLTRERLVSQVQDFFRGENLLIVFGTGPRFLFVGYGMNDSHLETEIRKKLNGGIPGLVVTMASNPRIDELAARSPNLWVVSGFEDNPESGTRIMNCAEGQLAVSGEKLWDMREFTSQMLGD